MADNDEQKPSITWGRPRRRVWAAMPDELRAQKEAVAAQISASDTSIQKAATRLARLDAERKTHEENLARAPRAVIDARQDLGRAKDFAVEFANAFGWDREILLNPAFDADGQNQSDAATRAFGPLKTRPGAPGVRNYFDDAKFSANVSFTAEVPSASMTTSQTGPGRGDDGEERYIERQTALKPVTAWRSDFHDRSAAEHRNKLSDLLADSTWDPSPEELDLYRSPEPGVENPQPKKIEFIKDLFAHLNAQARAEMEKDHEALREAAGVQSQPAGAVQHVPSDDGAGSGRERNAAEKLHDAMAQSVEQRIETETQLFDYFEQCAQRDLDRQFVEHYFAADEDEWRDAWLQSNSTQPQMPEALRDRFVAELEHIADGSSAFNPGTQTEHRAALNELMLNVARAALAVDEASEFAADVDDDFEAFNEVAGKVQRQVDGLSRLDPTTSVRVAAARNEAAKQGASKQDAPAAISPMSQSDWLTGYTSSALEDVLSAQRSNRLASTAEAETPIVSAPEQPAESVAPEAQPTPASVPDANSERHVAAMTATAAATTEAFDTEPEEAIGETPAPRAPRGWPTNALAGNAATASPVTRWGAPRAAAQPAAPSATPAPSHTDEGPAMAQTEPLVQPAAAEHVASAPVEAANTAQKTALPGAWAQATAAEASEHAPAPVATASNPTADPATDSGSLAQAAGGIDTPGATLSGMGGLRERLAAQKAGATAVAGQQSEGEGKQRQGAAASAEIEAPQSALSGIGGLRDRLAAQQADAKTAMQGIHPEPKKTDGGPEMAQNETLDQPAARAASTPVEATNPAPKTAMPWMQGAVAQAPEQAPAPAANAANPMATGSWIDSVALAQTSADTSKPQETLSGLGGLQARRAAQEAGARTTAAAQGEGEGKQSQGAAAAPTRAMPPIDNVTRVPAPQADARPSPEPRFESLNAIAARLKDDPEADPQLRKDAMDFEKLRGNMTGPKGEVILGVDATIAKVARDQKAHEESPHHAAMQEKHAAGQNLGRDELAELAKNPYAGSVLAHPNLARYREEMGLSEREVGKSTFDTEITQCVTTDNVKTKGLSAQAGNSQPVDAEQIHASLQGAAGDWLAQRRALRAAAASTTGGQQPTDAQKQKRGFSV